MWSEGIIANPTTNNKFKYWVKHFEENSEFGIDGGKVSKSEYRPNKRNFWKRASFKSTRLRGFSEYLRT
jgi:hypothetical protein